MSTRKQLHIVQDGSDVSTVSIEYEPQSIIVGFHSFLIQNISQEWETVSYSQPFEFYLETCFSQRSGLWVPRIVGGQDQRILGLLDYLEDGGYCSLISSEVDPIYLIQKN